MKDTSRADHTMLARAQHCGTPTSPAEYDRQFTDDSGT